MTNHELLKWLQKKDACKEGAGWVSNKGGTLNQLWKSCQNGDWMLWFIRQRGKSITWGTQRTMTQTAFKRMFESSQAIEERFLVHLRERDPRSRTVARILEEMGPRIERYADTPTMASASANAIEHYVEYKIPHVFNGKLTATRKRQSQLFTLLLRKFADMVREEWPKCPVA